MTDRERVAVTVIGTNLVMDYGTNERAVAAMDALAAGVTLSPSLDEGLDVAAARWAAQAYRVCGVDRRQTDALIKAGLLYPSLDEGLREALQAAFAAMDGTLFWSHGSQCPLRYNVNLPDPCTCGVDVAQSALRAALAQEGETPT